jgi:3-deoxy-7-phosphoheptulonate synthase
LVQTVKLLFPQETSATTGKTILPPKEISWYLFHDTTTGRVATKQFGITNTEDLVLIVMNHNAGKKQIEAVINAVERMGFSAAPIPGGVRTAIGVLGNVDDSTVRALPGVQEVIHVSKPYKLVSRDFHPRNTIVKVAGLEIGTGKRPVIMAGPCAVESEEQIMKTARAVKAAGADMLRGGAFKPRTGPHTFQGMREEGLKLLALASRETGLPFVTEVMSPDTVGLVADYADMLQVGARNMQNFDLLRELGKIKKPILLKRGMSATIEEFLAAAEYILAEGNSGVILCERGIRTFETATRNTLDLAVIPLIKELSHLPVMVDPSHATGKRSLVPPMAKAALVAGADGLMLEVHPDPEKALSDGPQSLTLQGFEKLMREMDRLISFLES